MSQSVEKLNMSQSVCGVASGRNHRHVNKGDAVWINHEGGV